MSEAQPENLPSIEEVKHRIAELYAIKNIIAEQHNIPKLINDRIENFEEVLKLLEKAEPIKTEQSDKGIVWEPTQGPHGLYERGDYKENDGNIEFQQLLKETQEHSGAFNKDGFFIWEFRDGSLGRKPSKR
jgi:hypothetical protein